MNKFSLRTAELFREPLKSPARISKSPQISDPPRALRALASIVNNDLCHRCGTCVGICPTDALDIDYCEYPSIKNLTACTDCNLCVKVCPGDEFKAQEIASEFFDCQYDINDIHGFFTSAYLSHATDNRIRQEATSGGTVTALLVHLLESGAIDGAIVVSSDENILWKGKPILALSKEEILAATKSKYSIVGTNSVLKTIRNRDGRYAVVGLPCHIHGIQKARLLDKRICDRVVLTIGLLCHAAIEHDAFEVIWQSLGDYRNDAKKFISRVGKHPGTPHVVLADGSLMPVYFSKMRKFRPTSMDMINILYRLFTPARCLTCYDATAEFADIAVGDPWMKSPASDIDFYEGYSYVLTRNKKAQELLEKAEKEKALKLIPLNQTAARTCNRIMGKEKRLRAFRLLTTRKRQGLPIPNYGFLPSRPKFADRIHTELNLLSHLFCFAKKGRRLLLRIMLSPAGYPLLWLNHLRRKYIMKK